MDLRSRIMDKADLFELQRIHQRFYDKEFSFPNFLDEFIYPFVIRVNNRIVTAGGIRPLAEMVLITDQAVNIDERREALLEALALAADVAKRAKFHDMHAFVQDEKWLRHLVQHGWSKTVGQSLVIGV